jgi:hypothetical protein
MYVIKSTIGINATPVALLINVKLKIYEVAGLSMSKTYPNNFNKTVFREYAKAIASRMNRKRTNPLPSQAESMPKISMA